jgi:hypothetical protein
MLSVTLVRNMLYGQYFMNAGSLFDLAFRRREHRG